MTRVAVPRVALGALPLLALAPWLVGETYAPVSPPPSEVARGASLGLFASDPEFNYGGMLDEMTDRGARDVLIVERWMQSDIGADNLRRVPGFSPSVSTVARTLSQAQARGMRVSYMPIVGLRVAHAPTEWRGVLAPRRGADVWFDRYRTLVLAAARLASANGVTRLILGSELNWLEHREDLFRELVRDVRVVFDGELTYSANWDRYRSVSFWDALDTISVSAYFGISATDDPSREQARVAWLRQLAELGVFAQAHERPLLLSEVGYPAHAEAASFPWDETRAAPTDQALQATLLGAFCEAYETSPGAGYFVWNWFGRGGPRDRGYTPRGKPAAAEFERCMRTEARQR